MDRLKRKPLREAFDRIKTPDSRPASLQKGLNAIKRNLNNSVMGAFSIWKLRLLKDRLDRENDKKQHKNKADDAMKKLMLMFKKSLGYAFWSWKDKKD